MRKQLGRSFIVLFFSVLSLEAATQIGVSPSGHYITYRGKTLLLAGDSGTQCVMQNANINYREWIDDCAERGIRAVHIWSFVAPRQTADGRVIENRYGYVYPGLTPWARKNSGPEATDGLKQWDLKTFDEGSGDRHWWPRLRGLCAYARDRGLLVGITVFFGWPKWNTSSRPDWSYHPLNVVNGGPVSDSASMVTKAQTIADPSREVWSQEWSDSWPAAKKTQWIWERFALKLIEDTAEYGNVFFVFMDEHSYSEGNCGDHFARFFRSRGAVWVDWEPRRGRVDFVYSDTLGRTDKNSAALSGFKRDPARPYLFLEGGPYKGEEVRTSMWSFLLGGGHFFFHADERQETPRTGIMGYDPHVPGGNKGMIKRDWLGHASRFFNEEISDLDSLRPHNELVSGGVWCLCDPGREYAVYSVMGNENPIELDLRGVSGAFKCRFYDPRSGAFGPAFFVRGGERAFFVKPDQKDWAIHLVRDDGTGAPIAVFTVKPETARPGAKVEFDASASSDPGGEVEGWEWDFGDGSTASGAKASHVFERQGGYIVILKVTDKEGNVTKTSKRIEITAGGGALLRRVLKVEPEGTRLGGSVPLNSVTVEGDLVLTDLVGVSEVRPSGSLSAGRTRDLPGTTAARALEGLELGYAVLGLAERGEYVDVWFPETVRPDGSPAPEILIIEWAASCDTFQVQLLSNSSSEATRRLATVKIKSSDYAATATTLDTTVGEQPVGGIAINLDALDLEEGAVVRGLRLPAEDGAGGITGLDPSVVAYAPSPVVLFERGDANADGVVDIADAVKVLNYLFGGGAAFDCFDAADGNDDGKIDLADAVSVLAFLFAGAGPLPAPAGACGPDPTDDPLDCMTFPPCV